MGRDRPAGGQRSAVRYRTQWAIGTTGVHPVPHAWCATDARGARRRCSFHHASRGCAGEARAPDGPTHHPQPDPRLEPRASGRFTTERVGRAAEEGAGWSSVPLRVEIRQPNVPLSFAGGPGTGVPCRTCPPGGDPRRRALPGQVADRPGERSRAGPTHVHRLHRTAVETSRGSGWKRLVGLRGPVDGRSVRRVRGSTVSAGADRRSGHVVHRAAADRS